MASEATSAIPTLSQGASVLPPPLPVLLPDFSVSDVSTDDKPSLSPQPMLVRQIRDQYWLETEAYMQKNPEVQMCEVLTSQIQWGWVYRIVREADGTLRRISKYEPTRDFRRPEFMEPT